MLPKVLSEEELLLEFSKEGLLVKFSNEGLLLELSSLVGLVPNPGVFLEFRPSPQRLLCTSLELCKSTRI